MRINSSSNLPHGYGVGSVKKVAKPNMEIYKDREKQNEEKKETLYKQKAFLEELRKAEMKAMLDETDISEEKGKHINTRA